MQDFNKALKAASAAQEHMTAALDNPKKLPQWKQRHYPAFAQQILVQQQAAETAWSEQPDWRKQDPANTELCQ